MEPTLKERRITELFRISVMLKGAHALLEIIGGVLFLVIAPKISLIPQLVASFTQEELANDPNDLVANFLLHTANQLSISSDLFAAFYLLSHGIIKIILVIALLKNKLWAYPWSLVVLGIFIAYQLYRFTDTHSVFLILLTVFDLAVMYLIWREYKIIKLHRQATA